MKGREHLNKDIEIKQEYFLSLLCLATFTIRKTWMGVIWQSLFMVQQLYRRQKSRSVGLWHSPYSFRCFELKKEKMVLPESCKSHHIGLIGDSLKCYTACTQPLCWSITKVLWTSASLYNLALKKETNPWPFPISQHSHSQSILPCIINYPGPNNML